MSFGDPNNPYGAPQAQQPGYGYPQQGQQPGYGYPQAPPVGAYGMPPAPETMPGTVSAARVMMWVIVALQVVGAGLFAFGAIGVNAAKNDNELKDDAGFQQLADYSSGLLWGSRCSPWPGRCSPSCWRSSSATAATASASRR